MAATQRARTRHGGTSRAAAIAPALGGRASGGAGRAGGEPGLGGPGLSDHEDRGRRRVRALASLVIACQARAWARAALGSALRAT